MSRFQSEKKVCRNGALPLGSLCHFPILWYTWPMPTLNWIGKEKVVNHWRDVPFRVLNRTYSFDSEGKHEADNNSENMIIHGDNLDALKALLPEYAGRIKCIYIDPPYNTGNEGWVYNDNVKDPHIQKWLHTVVGREGEDLSRHDKWLCMMYPRLVLLQKLLSEDGAIIVSIGYQEISNLILLCKEIFTTKQIVPVTVQTSGGKPSGGFNLQHEYLVFIVSIDFEPKDMTFAGGNIRTPFEGMTLATFTKDQRPNQTYPIFVDEINGSLSGIGKSLAERISSGEYTGKPEEFKYDYSEAPKGTVAVWPITSKGKDCVWRLIPSRLQNDWDRGYIKISINKSKQSKNKYSITYLPIGVIKKIQSGELQVTGKVSDVPTLEFGQNLTVGSAVPTLWLEKSFYTEKGTLILSEIFHDIKGKIFNYPKSLELLEEVIRVITDEDSLVLDSFAGSGTTAHAVLNLNKADGGNRKFILVEMMDYAESITAERVKRVIKGYPDTEGTGGDFSYYELGEPLLNEQGNLNAHIGTRKIREYVYYTETGNALEETDSRNTYYLGTCYDTSYYFYYEKDVTTTLSFDFLCSLRKRTENYVIYADRCTLSASELEKYRITFKKIPRDIARL
jgi:adenine-specific DNA-methyltransferase